MPAHRGRQRIGGANDGADAHSAREKLRDEQAPRRPRRADHEHGLRGIHESRTLRRLHEASSARAPLARPMTDDLRLVRRSPARPLLVLGEREGPLVVPRLGARFPATAQKERDFVFDLPRRA